MSVPTLRFPEFSKEWACKTFDSIGHFYYGKSAPKWAIEENAVTPCVRYGELYSKFNGIVDKIYSYTNLPQNELKFSKGGEVLIPRVGENPLDFSLASYLPLANVAIGEMISVFNTKQNGLYLTYYIRAKLKKSFARLVEGGNVSNLYFRYLEPIKVYLPELEEQTKIANFLTAVDEKIHYLSQKYDLLIKYKKGVMQQIFSQELRFMDDGQAFPEWEERSLGDFLIPDFREVNKPKGGYLSIGVRSHCKGTFQKPDADPEKNSMDKLFVVHQGDLIVNITFAWEGAIAIVKEEDHGGYVSHRFPTYTFKPELTSSKFFQYVFVLPKFRERLDLISPGGAGRNRVLSKKEFLKMTCNLPSLKEQTKIANFLTAIDDKIITTQTQLEAVKQYKQGLLQQMFV